MKAFLGTVLMDTQLRQILKNLDAVQRSEQIDPETKTLVFRAISAHVDYLVRPNVMLHLAGPVATTMSGASSTTAFDCPQCGARLHATIS